MLKQELISLNDAAGWRNALAGLPHAFAHTWEYVSAWAQTLRSSETVWLYVAEQAGWRRVCPLAERDWRGQRDIVTPYGFSGFTGNGMPHDGRAGWLAAWCDFAARRGWVCGYLGLHPVLDASSYEMDGPLAGLSRTHSSNQVFALDLTQTETQLAAGLSHNVRQRLRDWRRSGARLLDEPAQLKEFFMAEYAACMRRLGAAPVYDFPPALLEALLRHEALFLLGAENASGELEAVSVFGYTAHCGEYLFNVALPSGRRHSAALLWEGLRHLKSKDVPLANLGGGVQAGDGLAQFKARFGGQALPLRALKQVYRAEAYQACCHEAGVQAQAETGYFPPYRAPVPRVTG